MSESSDDRNRRLIKGRGAVSNREGRFESVRHVREDDGWDLAQEPEPAPKTQVMVDKSRRVISYNQSPDIPFDRSLNPYRGCEHGCIYCFARPTHAYWGLSAGLDFETRLFYKPDAVAQLRHELSARNYRCAPIALGINTDAWQPLEKRLRMTRAILETLYECRHPVSIITKSGLIERDLDLLTALAQERLLSLSITLTTLDDDLNRVLEPRAAGPRRRLAVISHLAQAGIPVSVMVAPVIPLITDGELEAILTAARDHGARAAHYIVLRLPLEVEGLFEEWLSTHYPGKAAHVLSLLRDIHGGRIYRSEFGLRMRGSGEYAELLAQRFRLARRRVGLDETLPALDVSRFRPPQAERARDQLELF